MTDIRYHPNTDLLADYASGDLDPASSILISSHLELCPQCQQHVAQLEVQEARSLALTPHEPLSEELSAMMAQILTRSDTDKTQEAPHDEATPEVSQTITVNNKVFPLPRALRAHADQIGPWSRLPGNLKRAHVNTGGESKMNFIYMDCDSALPQHTHQGQEITLVLAGEFVDEKATYRPGDFIVLTPEHQHTPKTRPDMDCLCLTLLDAPLHFTSGLATLLNPFSQLFFR
ncbi:ChrR family anti-sigma-E factor [Photobacterium atrarenae]|uniref:ChrR family anti-sigma-E factor n=1 Tax=Photobacterium atrarenae TaxID=865757 RepID=A0ABY5GK19_9GAMM|nr:ChrR family anti-sigma-E factor [Photobacterium atrarenae]UTV29491.1 ChrR family anti-sigma-E factor [Photobacterium atrarenae]